MPFNVNNVDVTVAANVIYGITVVALTNMTEHPTALIDADVEVCNSYKNFLEETVLTSTHNHNICSLKRLRNKPRSMLRAQTRKLTRGVFLY